MRYISNWCYALNLQHGFGIIVGDADSSGMCHCFFEDGTYESVQKGDVDRDAAIQYLYEDYKYRSYRFPSKIIKLADSIIPQSSCMFIPRKEGSIGAVFSYGTEKYEIIIAKDRYFLSSSCSCGKQNCAHYCAAGSFLASRIQNLKHAYITSELPLDKSLFLESALTSAVDNLREDCLDKALIDAIRHIINLLDSAHSDAYYRRFHDFMLDMEPYDYSSNFIEDYYGYLVMALFDVPDYRDAVVETGFYDDSGGYEERQHRSNRASYKRILKRYNTVLKELSKGDYQEDCYKEFILKYRNDLTGLLRYYAESKTEIEHYDLLYLREIAALQDIDIECLKAAAAKLDSLYEDEEAIKVFHALADRIPAAQIVGLYSGLRNITMPMDDVKKLVMEEQQKMVNNIPVTMGNFCYVLDHILNNADDRTKGAFILRTIDRMGFSRDTKFKKAVAQRTAQLPNSRLLLAFVLRKLNLKDKIEQSEGDPEKELTGFFENSYEIINKETSFFCDFMIKHPNEDKVLICVREEGGKLLLRLTSQGYPDYKPELIKKVCLMGREEEYREACERNQDLVDAFLFEKENKKFASEYRQLCASFDDGKLLLAGTAKVGIEWLIFRDSESNALAFKVGNTRKYVVKDASDFLRAFKTGQTTGYGKDLVLTHDTDNLEENDAAAIRILMAARYSKGRKSDKSNKRYITISDSLFGNLLELLAGRTIYYNESPCRLRMERQEVRLKLSDSYKLSADIDTSRQEFINLLGKGYLVDRQHDGSSVMDRVGGTSDEINLIDLAYRNPSVSVKPILKDFQKNIYSRFFESIDVDKKIQPELARSQLRLNTYFDFEKSAITARTVILRDGKEIPAESLSDRIDRVKLELLENHLTALGFSDGRLTDEARILAFFKLDFGRMKNLTNVYLSENLQNKELKSVGRPVIRVTYNNNLVNVFLEKSEYSESELEQIIAGLRKKKKYILLSGDKIVDLDSEAAKDLGEAVQDFGMNPKDLYKKKTISFVTAIKAFSHQRSCRVDKYLRDMIEEIRSFKEADIDLPKLNGTLREYQEEGFKWMSVLSRYGMGGILADDMGLGKTIQVIALIRSDNSQMPSLVVCPKSLVFNWVNEFAKFDGSTSVTAIYGPESRRSEIIAAIDHHKKGVYITSYDSLRNDIDKYSGGFNYGILDEAQYIKNVRAQKTQSVKELKVRHRFALTGTPIENSVIDLWSIFDYIMPGYFEELSRFRDSATDAIARKAAPFILRRVKEDVLEDLPPKYERILSAEMSSEQRKIYESMRYEAQKALNEGGKAFDILPYLTRLRQVCVDPGMFVEGYTGGSGKMDMLDSLITEYLDQNHRILIFSQFVKALEAVEALLKRRKIPTFFLSGSTSAKDRMDMMDSFNNGSGADVFLISLKAGGTGLNLTGADTVIHLDPWWNVAAENQASDRTHRIGQTKNVEIIKLIAADSIEQRVVELQDIKKEVIKQVISDDDGSVTSAKLEDIAFVLE